MLLTRSKHNDRDQAKAKCLEPRPRSRSRFSWPRDHFGLEDLTSLCIVFFRKNSFGHLGASDFRVSALSVASVATDFMLKCMSSREFETGQDSRSTLKV